MRHIFLRVLLAFALVAGVSAASQPTARADAPSALTAAVKVPAYPGQTKPLPGQLVTISGDIGTDGPRAVTLQKYTSSWSTYSSGTTLADGTFSFDASTTSASRRFRVTAAATTAFAAVTTSEVIVTTLADGVSLSVFRAGNTLQVTGQAKILLPGRGFALQYRSGSSWIPVTTDPAALVEDATGVIKGKTAVAGSKTYRLLGAPVDGLPAVASNFVAFSASPATLGKSVIYVTTDSGGTPTVKGKDYTGAATLVSGDTVTGPLRLETIAVRGNSSATKPKKPYKLKFVDKQKPFDMKSDRTWILLANYGDRALIRSRIAFDLGRKQTGLKWTPDERFTELYINGKYLGSYQLVQSIKIDGNRVKIDKNTGQIMEHDPHWTTDETEGFVGPSGMNYSYKDPDTLVGAAPFPGEELSSERMRLMKNKILQFESVLYSKDWSKITDGPGGTVLYNGLPLTPQQDWMTYLDLASSVDYILTREFTKDNDADFYRSNFFYTNDVRPFFNGENATYKYSYLTGDTSSAKFFMGPIWDFDRSAGAAPLGGTGISNTTGWWTNGSGSPNHDTNKKHWFTRVWKDPRFVAALKARWNDKKADYEAVSLGLDSGVNLAVARLDDPAAAVGATSSRVAANDRAKWGSSGSRYAAKSSSYAGEVAWLKNWYAKRYAWLEDQITNKL